MRLLWAEVFQRASRCQELWKAMSIALSASSLQMGGILLAPSRFWLILLLERVNSSSISGLWPDHQPDPGWDSWAGIQCNPGGGTGLWLWSLFFLGKRFGVYLIWSFRLCLACTLSGVTTFAWWVLASYLITRVLESGLICPILLMWHKAVVSPAGGWDWWRHWSASRPSQHQGLDHQIIKALQSWLHWLSWLWEKSRRYI